MMKLPSVLMVEGRFQRLVAFNINSSFLEKPFR